MSDQPTTRLPSGLNEEGAIISTDLFSLTLRQLSGVLGGLFMAYLTAEVLNNFVPGLFAWTLAAPILAFGVGVAFVKRRGRPLDEHIADRIRFAIEPDTYVLRDPNAQEAQWRDED